MFSIINYVLSIGSFFGVLLSGLLLFSRGSTTASKILSFWCLLLSIYVFGSFFYFETNNEHSQLITGFIQLLPTTFGPLLFLYIHYAINKETFKRRDFSHGVFYLVYFLSWLYLQLPATLTSASIVNFLVDEKAYIALPLTFIPAYVYLLLSCLILIKNYQTLWLHQRPFIMWSAGLILIYFLNWSIMSYATFVENSFLLFQVFYAQMSLFFVFLTIMQWRMPCIFRDLAIGEITPENTTENQTSKSQNIQRYGDNRLSDELRTSLFNELTLYMVKDQPYLNSQLSLPKLAELTGITSHHLSQVINEQENVNFQLYVNRYRIEELCRLLALHPSSRILDLAMDVGFSSKSSFNTMFKKIIGQTPSEYRKSLG